MMPSSAHEAARALRLNSAAARSFPKPLFTIDSDSFDLMGFNVLKRQGVVQYVTTVAAPAPEHPAHGEPSAWVATYADARTAEEEWRNVAFEFFHGIAMNSPRAVEPDPHEETPPLPEPRTMPLRIEGTEVEGVGMSIDGSSAVLFEFEGNAHSAAGLDSSLAHGIIRLDKLQL